MKGIIGCDNPHLQPGDVVTTGHSQELELTVIRAVTEQEARECADRLGMPCDIVPGESFYQVEGITKPIGGNN